MFIGATTTDPNFINNDDATPWNNKYFSGRFDITNDIYARDKGDINWSYGPWGINALGMFNPGDAIGLGVLYEFNNDAMLEEIILGVHQNTSITSNLPIVVEVYDFNNGQEVLVEDYSFVITPGQISGSQMNFIPLTLPSSLMLQKGITYEVRVRHNGNADDFFFGVAGLSQEQEDGSITVYHDGTNYIYTGTPSIPVIRLRATCINTSSSISEVVCDTYTAPDGQTYTNTGVYTAIIPNAAGCDSTITIDLTVNQSSSSTLTEVVCDSYTAPDGQVYTNSGNYTAILTNAAGCDSTITIDLTVNQSSSSTLTEVVCDSYTAPDGQVYTNSGNYTAIIPNAAGCDSTLTIDLTVNEGTTSTITETACDTYTAPDGQVYTNSGNYTAIIPNAVGCDSTITIDLTISEGTSSSITELVCGDSYTAPDGEVYTSSGNYIAIIPNAVGCDSTISIDLTIVDIDPSVDQQGATLTAVHPDADYQWLECDGGDLTPITGETNQSFTATANGSYAVIITDQGCEVTSDCITIDNLNLSEEQKGAISLYPNPTKDKVTIELDGVAATGTITVLDATGRLVLTRSIHATTELVDLSNVASGVLIIQVQTATQEQNFRVVKLD